MHPVDKGQTLPTHEAGIKVHTMLSLESINLLKSVADGIVMKEGSIISGIKEIDAWRHLDQ